VTEAAPADAGWLSRNLGMAAPAPHREMAPADQKPPTASEERARMRDLIEFDSEGATGAAFFAAAPLANGLSRFQEIPWPKGLAPAPGPRPSGSRLPKCDVLMVTWTVDEAHALSRVLTPGFDSRNDWLPYKRNFAAITARMRAGAPALQAGNLGSYWTTTIGTKKVTLFKSGSHMSQDGPLLPNADLWRQIIDDSRPTWVITTGTGGGIGTAVEVGDVIVSPFVTFSCRRTFKRFDGDTYVSREVAPSGRFKKATALFKPNAVFLPADNTRPPEILASAAPETGVLTTDYFGFDTSANTYGLQGKGELSEMGDAVLGMVCKERGAKAPAYAVVRNVSDQQIASGTLTIREQEKIAADIYKGFGRWSSVCSAIVCWAIVAGLP
jgi:nucleoside phosphorylase